MRSLCLLHALLGALLLAGCGRTATRGLDFSGQPAPKAGTAAGEGGRGGGGAGRAGSQSGGGTIAPPPMAGRGNPPPPPPMGCGNGRLDPGEQCDGAISFACSDVNLGMGEISCDRNTCLYDVSGCSAWNECMLPPSSLPPSCLAGLCDCNAEALASCDERCMRLLECKRAACGGETVDAGCLVTACEPLGGQIHPGWPTLLICLANSWQLCGPGTVPQPGKCGDGVISPGEACDPRVPMGNEPNCATFGFPSGQLRCDPIECDYDFSNCSANVCGNGLLEVAEACDGSDFGGQSCRSLGFGSGQLRCTSFCSIDSSGCRLCGNGRVEEGEACDGTRLAGQSCRSLGYTGGTLACTRSCAFDTGACGVCGDGEVTPGENCDGSDLRGESCESLGFGTGTLACSASSCHFDTGGCTQTATCGNGVAEADEQCDGDDLTDHSCSTLGFRRGGELRCNPTTCRFDTSACDAGPDLGCSNACIEEVCGTALETCANTMGCVEARACFDDCHDQFSLECVRGCVTSIESVAVATIAADCVADCAESCR